MNTLSLLTLALLMAVAPTASAKVTRARLMKTDTSQEDVLITEFRNGILTYKLKDNDLNRKKVRLTSLESVYFYKPDLFAEAMTLYKGRKYAEAKEKFVACQLAFKSIGDAPNNYATLSGYYSLECSRRQFKFDELASEQEKFRKDGLTREFHLQQLEVNAFWDAVRAKSWDRLDRLAESWEKRKVTGSQRAQISYCHGLALEQLAKKNPNKHTDALNAYNRVLSADFSASSEIVIKAANRILRMYHSDPKVELAKKLWGTEDENKGGSGYQRLLEANAFLKLYKLVGWDAIKPIAPEFEEFSKYTDGEDN